MNHSQSHQCAFHLKLNQLKKPSERTAKMGSSAKSNRLLNSSMHSTPNSIRTQTTVLKSTKVTYGADGRPLLTGMSITSSTSPNSPVILAKKRSLELSQSRRAAAQAQKDNIKRRQELWKFGTDGKPVEGKEKLGKSGVQAKDEDAPAAEVQEVAQQQAESSSTTSSHEASYEEPQVKEHEESPKEEHEEHEEQPEEERGAEEEAEDESSQSEAQQEEEEN
eukprot:gnl/Chilomastix_caulleri/483.p1 GENE.gnl/Chilomastix_caulleri/483~~gnl/Chilomastix_caulleri/483.p1  ORF type:complete len:221 (+),score=61.66 gnl/Chilomastix_caulleri/483:29-691(+)